MGLTALAIKSAKGAEKKYKMNDAGEIYLLVMPSGNRYWRMNYPFADKHKTPALGGYLQRKSDIIIGSHHQQSRQSSDRGRRNRSPRPRVSTNARNKPQASATCGVRKLKATIYRRLRAD